MGFFIDEKNDYYEGDKAVNTHRDVPQRPSPDYIWNNGWVIDQEKVDKREAERVLAETKLQTIADGLPSWETINNNITSATTIAALKEIVRKMARIMYLEFKGSID